MARRASPLPGSSGRLTGDLSRLPASRRMITHNVAWNSWSAVFDWSVRPRSRRKGRLTRSGTGMAERAPLSVGRTKVAFRPSLRLRSDGKIVTEIRFLYLNHLSNCHLLKIETLLVRRSGNQKKFLTRGFLTLNSLFEADGSFPRPHSLGAGSTSCPKSIVLDSSSYSFSNMVSRSVP